MLLSYYLYKECGLFAYYDSKNEVLVKFPNDLLSTLTTTLNASENHRRYEYLSEYLCHFHKFKEDQPDFLLEENDVDDVYGASDYDCLTYFDYALNGKRVYRYKGLEFSLPIKDSNFFQQSVFEVIRNIYLSEKSALLKTFIEATESVGFKTILRGTNNVLLEKLDNLKSSSEQTLLDYYLQICPKIDLKEMEFVLSGFRGTLVSVSKSLINNKNCFDINQFVSSKELDKILKHYFTSEGYDDFTHQIDKEFLALSK